MHGMQRKVVYIPYSCGIKAHVPKPSVPAVDVSVPTDAEEAL